MKSKSNLKKYKYVLFDWDGCLARTLDIWLNAYKVAYAEYGLHPTDLEITHHFGDWEAPKYYGINDVEGCINKIDAIASSDLKKVELYKGVRDILERLYSKRKMALLTSSPRNIIEAAIAHNRVLKYFQVVLTGEDVTHHKPHPEVINKGLAELGGEKSQAIIIGDSRKDLEAANNAGVDSILFYPETHKLFYKFDELMGYKPTYVVYDFVDVGDIILGKK